MTHRTRIKRYLWRAAIVLIGLLVVVPPSAGWLARRPLSGVETPPPGDFSFVGSMTPCHLELARGTDALRVNCFQIDGVLHIHSSRWAKLPRFGTENWVVTVRREPEVRIEIADRIYAMRASVIDDEAMRQAILDDRGYSYPWDGITVVRFIAHR